MKILALSPHTDDTELGAGGSITLWLDRGHSIRVIAFSTGNEHTGANESEFRASCDTLGVTDIEILDYPCRKYHTERQRLLQFLVDEKREYEPDVVLCPATWDIHQDHRVVCAETMRAMRGCTLLGYDIPHNSITGCQLGVFVKLEVQHVMTKVAAIECYTSQAHRMPMKGQNIVALARLRGVQCGELFAEAFEVIRWIDKGRGCL